MSFKHFSLTAPNLANHSFLSLFLHPHVLCFSFSKPEMMRQLVQRDWPGQNWVYVRVRGMGGVMVGVVVGIRVWVKVGDVMGGHG